MNDLHKNLGTGLRERERRRQEEFKYHGTGLNTIMPPSLAWDAFFGGMRENGVDRLADQSVGERRGMFSPSIEALGTAEDIQPVDPSWTSPTYQWAKQDEQERATGTGRHYQDTETFIKRFRK